MARIADVIRRWLRYIRTVTVGLQGPLQAPRPDGSERRSLWMAKQNGQMAQTVHTSLLAPGEPGLAESGVRVPVVSPSCFTQ